jgi:hypothetical protein
MKLIERRLQALEAKQRRRGVRHFIGYEATGKYYEQKAGESNSSFGINGEGEEELSFTKEDIAQLESEGWECITLTIQYMVNWRDSTMPDADEKLLATVQPGYIDKLLS